MDLSWELEQLAHAAAPDLVLEGHRLVHRVSDVIQCDDGRIEALVRGEVAHVVALQGRYPLDLASCTCGDSRLRTTCPHAIAAWLRALQRFHGLDDSRLARWERRVESLHALSSAWGGLADFWLESITVDDDAAAAAVFRDAGSLEGGVQIARALAGRASSEQLSAYLLELAATRYIDGRTPLGPEGIIDAYDLVCQLWGPGTSEDPGAHTAILLAVAGSSRRTATTPSENWRVESAFTFSCAALGELVAGGHADPTVVGDALLRAELAAPASDYPWIALMFDNFGGGASLIAQEMRLLLEHREHHPGVERTEDQWRRVRAEIGFASEGVAGLLPALEEWADAPYGEFLCRLPGSWVPTSRMLLLESAHRAGRVRWAPGWPQHVPHPGPRRRVRVIHDLIPRHPMWGDAAVGDLVVAVAHLGRESDGRDILRDHARRHPDPAHRHEFERIWAAAKLGDGAEASAAEIFGPADDDLGELLAAISRIPERYFESDLSDARQGIGTALLTSILLEDITPESRARNLDASMWATSFLSSYPAAVDDLAAFAALPADEVACGLEGAVLDQERALRIQRVAGQLVAGGCPVLSLADVRAMGEQQLVDALERVPDAGPLTASLVALVLWGNCPAPLESVLGRFLRDAVGDVPGDAVELLERAYSAEPRGADLPAYLLALIAIELDGRAQRLRRR